jgi:hypothetical protein
MQQSDRLKAALAFPDNLEVRLLTPREKDYLRAMAELGSDGNGFLNGFMYPEFTQAYERARIHG